MRFSEVVSEGGKKQTIGYWRYMVISRHQGMKAGNAESAYMFRSQK